MECASLCQGMVRISAVSGVPYLIKLKSQINGKKKKKKQISVFDSITFNHRSIINGHGKMCLVRSDVNIC